ncbi:MAG: serine protease [Polyangiaceae bacterium]
MTASRQAGSPLSEEGARRLALLLARAEGVLAGESVSAAVPRRKAIVFLGVAEAAALGAVVDEVRAQRAVDAIRRIQDITRRGDIPSVEDLPAKEDVEALEVCIRFLRPSLLVKGDRVVGEPAVAWSAAQRAVIEAALPFVGSIGAPSRRPGPFGGAPSRLGIATCFAIGPRAVVTNVHVLDQLARDGLSASDTVVRFDVEWDAPSRLAPVAVKGELGRHPERDVVILELCADCPPAAGLPLSTGAEPAALAPVAAIGHPLSAGWPAVGAGDVRGEIRGEARVSGGGDGVERAVLYHDASTLKSGRPFRLSPVLDVETGARGGGSLAGGLRPGPDELSGSPALAAAAGVIGRHHQVGIRPGGGVLSLLACRAIAAGRSRQRCQCVTNRREGLALEEVSLHLASIKYRKRAGGDA